MKRIIIVVEGQTERDFVKYCLAPYLASKFGLVSVSARLIGKPGHKGGDVRYERLRTDINILLRERDTFISTFIDYFKLHSDFPKFATCQQITDIDLRISSLEKAVNENINQQNFTAYIQKHEFEALLFSDTQRLDKYLNQATCLALDQVSYEFSNPESINDKNPPSYRLTEIFRQHQSARYDKVAFGNILALETGIEAILTRCPRFAAWVTRLASAAQN